MKAYEVTQKTTVIQKVVVTANSRKEAVTQANTGLGVAVTRNVTKADSVRVAR
jgi:hypothetical protein